MAYWGINHLAGLSGYELAVNEDKVTTGLDRDPQYLKLQEILDKAYSRAAYGKGKERHARSLPFEQQYICKGMRVFGAGGGLFQIGKKAEECMVLSKPAAMNELLDIMVYAAAAYIILEEENSKSG